MNNQSEDLAESRGQGAENQASAHNLHKRITGPIDDDSINLRELSGVIWGYRKPIATFVLLTTVLAGLDAFLTPNYYKADTLISPVDNSELGGKSSQFAALGGLAGLAGLSVDSDNSKDVAIATLSSRVLIESMIRDKNLMPVLFENSWDKEKQDWKNPDPKKHPTLLDGYTLFTKVITKINEDKKKGLLTITVEWKSPVLAAEWANELVRRANDTLRTRALDESEHNLTYLQEQAQQTSIVEVRHAIFGLMESELKEAMLAKGNEEYAFKVVDPAVVPDRKSRPKRLMTLIYGFLAGVFVGCVAALLYQRTSTLWSNVET